MHCSVWRSEYLAARSVRTGDDAAAMPALVGPGHFPTKDNDIDIEDRTGRCAFIGNAAVLRRR